MKGMKYYFSDVITETNIIFYSAIATYDYTICCGALH